MTIIVATDRNGCIGKDGGIPWHLPEDLKHFRNTTMGGTVIMGRKTWESIPEKYRPLKGRHNIVLSRQSGYNPKGAMRVKAFQEALFEASEIGREIYVIGGGMVYRSMLPYCDRIILSKVDTVVEDGDTFFDFNREGWTLDEIDECDGFRIEDWVRINRIEKLPFIDEYTEPEEKHEPSQGQWETFQDAGRNDIFRRQTPAGFEYMDLNGFSIFPQVMDRAALEFILRDSWGAEIVWPRE